MRLSLCKSFLIYGFIRAESLIIPQKLKRNFIALTQFTIDLVSLLLLILLQNVCTSLPLKMVRDGTSH